MECKYPMQCASIVRNQTLGVEARLTRTNINEGESPLEMYNGFSRFPFVLINEDKVAATANVPIDEMLYMLKRSDFALNKQLEREMCPVISDEPLSIAYTTKITAGNLKGKTPAEVYLSDPENGKTELNNHFNWLKQNLEKYPKNRQIMDAIKEAGKLAQEGKLTAKSVNKGSFTLLDPGMRPLTRKTKPDAKTGNVSLKPGESLVGNCFVYEIKITWIFDNNYPIQVEILNYYAPVVKNGKGLLNVKKSAMDKDTLVPNSINLSIMEWNSVVSGIKRSIKIFENTYGTVALKESMDLDKSNRENHSHQSQDSSQNNRSNAPVQNQNKESVSQQQQQPIANTSTQTDNASDFLGLDDDELPFN